MGAALRDHQCNYPMKTRSFIIIVAAFAGLALAAVQPAHADTITVTNTNDAGAGSLRDAIAVAASGDTVTFAAPLFDTPQVIDINGQLEIAKNLTITGRGANLLTIRNVAAPSTTSRVFVVSAGFTVELSGMTVTGGNVTGDGGGIFNGGTLTLRFVHVTGNTTASRLWRRYSQHPAH